MDQSRETSSASWGVYAWVPLPPFLGALSVAPVTKDNRPIYGKRHPRRAQARLMTPGTTPLSLPAACQRLKELRGQAIAVDLWLYPGVASLWLYPGHQLTYDRRHVPSGLKTSPRIVAFETGRDGLEENIEEESSRGGLLVQIVTDHNQAFQGELQASQTRLEERASKMASAQVRSPLEAWQAAVELAREHIGDQKPGPTRDMLLSKLARARPPAA